MGVPQVSHGVTPERVRALPEDGKRYNGEGILLVTPSPARAHQRALSELHLLLGNYLRSVGGAEALFSPSDVEFDPRTLVQPDLFVVRTGASEESGTWRREDLLLVVEVLSPPRHDTTG